MRKAWATSGIGEAGAAVEGVGDPDGAGFDAAMTEGSRGEVRLGA
jgi:hypothetical protein